VPFALARLPDRRGLAGGAAALGILLAATTLPIVFYAGTTSRYLVDFLPALVLLALVGFLGIEAASTAGRMPLGPLVAPILRVALAYSAVVAWLLAIALSSFYQGAERGTQMIEHGQIDDATTVFASVARVNPDFRGTADLSVGIGLLKSGPTRLAEATERLRAAAAEVPGDEQAHYALGQALLARGDVKGAAECFKRALEIAPRDGEAEANLGYAYFRDGRTAEAIEHLKAGLNIDPSLDMARVLLNQLESTRSKSP
jgi:tetratricopeptide (TPR) repeat protein